MPSSAQAQAPAGLCWFYSQLVRPADQPTDQNSTFWSQFDFLVKSKAVSLDAQTLEIFSDLNPIGHGAILSYFSHLAFWMSIFQAYYILEIIDEYSVSLVRPYKYLPFLTLSVIRLLTLFILWLQTLTLLVSGLSYPIFATLPSEWVFLPTLAQAPALTGLRWLYFTMLHVSPCLRWRVRSKYKVWIGSHVFHN